MRYWLLIAVVIAGLIFVPTPAYAASDVSSLCPNAHGQNYRLLLPYFNSRNQQVALVDQYSYKVVQVMADNVEAATFFSYSEGWSPSCRYFAFATGPYYGSMQTVIWDTVTQSIVGKFQQTFDDVSWIDWGADNELIVGTQAGRFIWKLPSNEQIQMEGHFAAFDAQWDAPHQRIFYFDGKYILAYDLNTGKLIRKFISQSDWQGTQFKLSPDGSRLIIFDGGLAVSWDINAGKIVDAQVLGVVSQENVEFSPDRRFLLLFDDYSIGIYDVTVAEKMVTDPCWPLTVIITNGSAWHFLGGDTIEISYGGKTYQYDLIAQKLNPAGWTQLPIEHICY